MRPKTGHRAPLDQSRIVTAAVELADEHGVGELSMRKVAGRLGCGAMSLYNHVADKDELLVLMVDAVAAEIRDPDPGARPLDAIRELATTTHEVFTAHPWAPELWLRTLPGPIRTRGMEELLALFARSGLSPEVAHHGFHAVQNHVVGFSLQEATMATGDEDMATRGRRYLDSLDPEAHRHTIAHLRQHLDGETGRSFELVLDLILDGLVRLDQVPRS